MREGVTVLHVGLGDVIAESVPAYPGPRGPSDRAEYASVLNLVAQGDGLDDVIERRRWEAQVAKLQYWKPVGAAECALYTANLT